jgi:hypothetical protein
MKDAVSKDCPYFCHKSIVCPFLVASKLQLSSKRDSTNIRGKEIETINVRNLFTAMSNVDSMLLLVERVVY